jgi:hypothetical protein
MTVTIPLFAGSFFISCIADPFFISCEKDPAERTNTKHTKDSKRFTMVDLLESECDVG